MCLFGFGVVQVYTAVSATNPSVQRQFDHWTAQSGGCHSYRCVRFVASKGFDATSISWHEMLTNILQRRRRRIRRRAMTMTHVSLQSDDVLLNLFYANQSNISPAATEDWLVWKGVWFQKRLERTVHQPSGTMVGVEAALPYKWPQYFIVIIIIMNFFLYCTFPAVHRGV